MLFFSINSLLKTLQLNHFEEFIIENTVMLIFSKSSSLRTLQCYSFRRVHHWKHCNVNPFEEFVIKNTAMLIFSKSSSMKTLYFKSFRRLSSFNTLQCYAFRRLRHWKYCNDILFVEIIIENTAMLICSKSSPLKTPYC